MTEQKQAYKTALTNYEEKLVKYLPMKDTIFIAKLSSHKLLPGDTNDQLDALPTPGEKARYLLNHVIKPALETEETSSFDNLLSVMKDCDYVHVIKLASEIKSKIDKATEPGKMCLCSIVPYIVGVK